LVFEEIPDAPKVEVTAVHVPIAEAAPEPSAPFEFLDLDDVAPSDPIEEASDGALPVETSEAPVTPVPMDDFVELTDEPVSEQVAPAVVATEIVATPVPVIPETLVPHKEPVVKVQETHSAPRPSLAVRGVKEAQKSPKLTAMPQAINSWTVASGVLKMIIMHPGYASTLDDKLAGIEITRHALDRVADKVVTNLGLPTNEGSRQKVKRHVLPVLESVWSYLFSTTAPNMDVDQVVEFTARFLGDAADLLSADPDELFLRSDRNLDMALARLTAMTRIQCELQPIFDVLDKYAQKNAAIGRIFFGDMTRREVLDDIYRLVEARAASFLDGVDLATAGDRDIAIVNRVVLRQSVDLMSGILRSEAAMSRLSSFAKEAPVKEGLLKEWLVAQYDEWTEGMPSLASMVSLHLGDQSVSETKKGPVL
jgi:hypothetical protein